MTRIIRNFFTRRKLLLSSIQIEIKTQHAGTVLGMSWIVIGPFLLMALYAIIYAVVFQVRLPSFSRAEYVINVFSGLVLFLAFAQAMATSTSVLWKEQKLIFSNFPMEFIPTKAVVVAYLVVLPASIFTILADIFFSTPTWHLFFVPIVALLQLFFSVGLGCLLALLGLVIKDISFLIQYIVTALLIATPIAYTPNMIPASIKPIMYLNPLYYYVSENQHLILLNELPPLFESFVSIVMSFSMFVFGVWMLKRARMAMMDLL